MLETFAAAELHIDIKTAPLFHIGDFAVTNAMATGLVATAIFVAIFWYVTVKVKRGQYNRFVGLVQWAFEGMYGQIESIIPNKEVTRKIAPVALTMFFFILVSYWMSILPGLDSITWNGSPVLRSTTADMNFTFALAFVSLVVTQFYAARQLGGIGNLKRYIRNPIKDPIGAFEGLLELIGEISRYSALSLRLFGNAFAGEVLLLVAGVLAGYAAVLTLPMFMAFELFIGFIQAYVFFLLTVIFTALALSHSHDDSDHSPAESSHKGDVPM